MAPVKINPDSIRAFKDAASFYKWLGKHHGKEDELWIKIHKVDSGLKSISPKEAIDVVLFSSNWTGFPPPAPMCRRYCGSDREIPQWGCHRR